jgi:PAS domain S-box-containing protein
LDDGIRGAEALYWRALVENSPDIILIIDTEGTALFFNRGASHPIVGRKLWEFTPDAGEERIRAVLRRLTETREAHRYEWIGYTLDGGIAWYEVSAIPLVIDDKVDRVLWQAANVTPRKRLEEQLRQSQKMEAIGLLAGGVAHDFNNLLAIIMGHADLAKHKLVSGESTESEIFEITDAAQRGAALTRKLLAFSRKQIIKPNPIDVRAAVDDFMRMFGRIVGEDVEVVFESPEPMPQQIVVHADAVQFEQVLLNLCTNARQAMPEGGTLRLAIGTVTFDAAFAGDHPWARVGSFAEIVVTDTGVGMDEATRARAFEPFFTTKSEGTGLGLATVYGIVQQHQGFVHVESAPGAGTKVRVYLPLTPAERPRTQPLSSRPPGAALRGRETILLAEDEPALRPVLSAMLSELGYRVITAIDGEQALEAFERQAQDIDLVVLDVVMPRLNARQAYERMRQIRPDLKVIFMTGYAPESTRLRELLDGAHRNILQKPFTSHALTKMVRAALDE